MFGLKKGGRGSWWDDENGTSILSISIRGLQTFFPFINLCIYIALTAFQSRWKVGISFLVGLIATALAADKLKFLRSLDRVMRQIRVAAIVNSLRAFCMIIMAIVTTVSANVGRCKDPSKDAHADFEGIQAALGGFCRNKKAGAAFFWLNAIAWLSALTLTLITFTRVRRSPQSTAFIPPGSSFPTSHEDFDADQEESFARSDPFNPPSQQAHYRPSHDYTSVEGERPFDGGFGTYHHNSTGTELGGMRDPFEDPAENEYGRSSRAGETVDPYHAIKKSMELGSGRRQDY
ncbi:hypothetical protein JCM5353_006264 [Sporobolomyces roseus]